MKTTWEWISKPKSSKSVLKDSWWNDCSLQTSVNLQRLADQGAEAVGVKTTFIDSFGTSRTFTCIGHDGATLTLHHTHVVNEGPVTLLCRPISQKLLATHYNVKHQAIQLSSMLTGELVISVQLQHHCDESWGRFTNKIAEMLEVPKGRVLLLPPGYVEADQIASWMRKPNNRMMVRNLLNVPREKQSRKRVRA